FPTGAALLTKTTLVANPAAARLASAVVCDWPTTFGTVTLAGPAEMTSATLVPGATIALPAGFWLITLPAATNGVLAVVTVVVSPFPLIADCAAVWVRPTTGGTGTPVGPTDTTS